MLGRIAARARPRRSTLTASPSSTSSSTRARSRRSRPHGAVDFGDAPEVAMSGRIVLPLFVDVHTHLDKGHIWRRKRNPVGDFPSALAATIEDRSANWTAADVAARMEFSLRSAYAHGTSAIRTHIDSVGPQTRISWPVVAEARERWRGRIDLQASPLFSIEFALDASHMADVEAMLDAHGTRNPRRRHPHGPRAARGARRPLRCSPSARAGSSTSTSTKAPIPRRARSRSSPTWRLSAAFTRPILVGHCCSLALQEEDERRKTIDAVARAGLSVVSLPMCNMFLQDREAGRTPRWRGVTALHELKRAGVNVMIASDNTRDPFYAYGDMDMMEVWREGRADPAPRLSVRRLGAGGLRFSGQGDGIGPRRSASRRARRHDPDASARLHRASGPSAIGSHRGAATAKPRTRRRPTMPNSTRSRVSRHERGLRHRSAARRDRSDQVGGQSHPGQAEEPRLLSGIRRC